LTAWLTGIDRPDITPTIDVASRTAREDGIAKSWAKVIFFAKEKLRIRSQPE
jgi:hypothetical protein